MLNKVELQDEITLWWEKPWKAAAYSAYVRFNGGERVKTEKTHCTFSSLAPDTEYTIEVEFFDGETLIDSENIVARTAVAKKKIDVTLFGVIGDGKTMNTAAIQKAADKLKKDEYLYFPKGVYLTGSIAFHDNSEIYLDEGAVIQGSENYKDYLPKIKVRFEGLETQAYSPLIRAGHMDSKTGQTIENIIIRGKGAILGGGKALCEGVIESEKERLKDYLEANAEYVKTCENDRTIPGRARPFLIDITNTKNVVVSGLKIGYGAAWNLHILYSKDISVYGCSFVSQGVWNGDGIDPDSSEDMAIFDCTFETHDDAIAVKSGKNPEGNIINRPMKNLSIFDCRGRNGIALGSEMSGGIENVYIWDCVIIDSYSGLRAKTTRKRGGYIRNVKVKDCTLTQFKMFCVPWNDDGESAGTLPEIKNFEFKNVVFGGYSIAYSGHKTRVPAIEICGFEDKKENLDNIILDGVKILLPKNLDNIIIVENADNVKIENVRYE